TYYEAATGDVGTTGSSTIVLNAPGGFVFDTSSPVPNVLLNGDGTRSKNINNTTDGSTIAVTATTTSLTITISSSSSSPGTPNILTWQNIRVRPTASSPLASGNITNSGTATVPGGTN